MEVKGGTTMATYLLKRKCTTEGYEDYFDLFLVWQRGNKVYHVLIKPTFKSAYRVLLARAVEIGSDEPFEKYI